MMAMMASASLSDTRALVPRGHRRSALAEQHIISPTHSDIQHSHSSLSCPGSCSKSKGRRRNAWYELTSIFFLYFCKVAFSPTHSPHAQCYFFDSDVGGFHYGPGHPYVPVLDNDHSIPKRALFFPCVILA